MTKENQAKNLTASASQNREQHTPGPWIISKSSHNREWSHWIESGNEGSRRLVAAIGNDGLRIGDNESNARLIAAAPALLDFVKSFLHAQESGIEPKATVARIDKAHFVIAQAEGRVNES